MTPRSASCVFVKVFYPSDHKLVADALALDGYPSVTTYNPATLAAALMQLSSPRVP